VQHTDFGNELYEAKAESRDAGSLLKLSSFTSAAGFIYKRLKASAEMALERHPHHGTSLSGKHDSTSQAIRYFVVYLI